MDNILRITSPVYDLEFKGKKYPVREVFVALCGYQLVTTNELMNVLKKNFGQAPLNEAETLAYLICATVKTLKELESLEEIVYGTM